MQCPHPITIKNPALEQCSAQLVRCESDGSYLTTLGELIPPTITVPCGKCIICQNARRDMWTARMQLEHLDHTCGWFVTLTYNEEMVPPYLCRADLRNWCKRVRKFVPFRYFACGEYGSHGGRPHFHVIMWFDVLIQQNDIDKLISDTWRMGFHTAKPVNRDNMRYVAKYTVKSAVEHPDSYPAPFAVMSRRPGIASNFYSSNLMFNMDYLALPDGSHVPTPRYFLDKMDPVQQIQIKRHRREYAELSPQLDPAAQDLRLINLERSMYRKYIRKYGK